MPNYNWLCEQESCSAVFEAFVPLVDFDNPAKNPRCPNCEGPTERIMSAPGFALTGHGWTKKSGIGRTK